MKASSTCTDELTTAMSSLAAMMMGVGGVIAWLGVADMMKCMLLSGITVSMKTSCEEMG